MIFSLLNFPRFIRHQAIFELEIKPLGHNSKLTGTNRLCLGTRDPFIGSKEGSPPALLHSGRRVFRLFSHLSHSLLRTRAYQPTAGLTSPCPQTEVNCHHFHFRDDMQSVLVPPAVVGFLDQDYCYKSVDTQIPHYAGMAQILPVGG